MIYNYRVYACVQIQSSLYSLVEGFEWKMIGISSNISGPNIEDKTDPPF